MSDFNVEKELGSIWEKYSELELKLFECQAHLKVGTTVWYFSAYEHSPNSGISLHDIAIMKGVITEKTFKDNWVAYVVDAKCWEGDSKETVSAQNLYLSKSLAYKAWLEKISDFERLPPDE